MNSDRIKEIQLETAYPNSVSVHQALLQVWNECEQEYRSQASDLPSDEQCDEIAFRKLLLTGRTESEEIQDRKLVIEGLTTMRSIASPLLASRDARIKELEEALKVSEEIVSELNRGYNRFM